MATITIYPEEPCLIPVTYASNPFTVYSKDFADITEVMMCLKTEATEDDDAYLRLYYKDGVGGGGATGDVLYDEPSLTFTMNKKETDVVPLGTYNIYIGVLVTGLTKMLWLRVEKDDLVIVTNDGVQQ